METINDFRLPVNTWLPREEIETGALAQIEATANHPEAVSHIAIMPDCHQGYGVTIGTAVTTEGSIIPNAVGVDIGCGVSFAETSLILAPDMKEDFWHEYAEHLRKVVPVGFSAHSKPQNVSDLLEYQKLGTDELNNLKGTKALYQYGTLGGGNHFLEVAVDESNKIWLLVHSGSRAIGHAIATHYHERAVEQSAARNLGVDSSLSSLLLDSEDGEGYYQDMLWAMDYAYASRSAMVGDMRQLLVYHVDKHFGINNVFFNSVDDISHNYAERSFDGLVTHRKGATDAHEDYVGVIPGSMGSNSYIVRGKAGPESWHSASHGAGRAMSRGKARKNIREEDFNQSMIGTFTRADMRDVDEAPGAYKDVQVVMDRSRDLVDILHVLRPVITVKGGGKARDD